MASCKEPNQCKNTTDNDMKNVEKKFNIYEIDGKKWMLPVSFHGHIENLRKVKLGPGDVWVMTQPRSGTTVTQELAWLLMNNLDFETAKKFHLVDRSPELVASLFPKIWQQCRIIRPSVEDPTVLESVPVDTNKNSYEVYANFPSPRVFKTHLALSVHKNILDSGCKVIYVFRNPKDSLVSRARFSCNGKSPLNKMSPEDFIRHQIRHDYSPSPYLPTWQHVKEAWAQRDHPNLLFLYYEDLRKDLPGTIKKVSAFLGKEYSDEQLAKLADHLHIDNFRQNEMVNELRGFEKHVSNFIGKGLVGGYVEIISPELEKEIDQWIEENTIGTDIMLPYRKNERLSTKV